MKISVVTVCYNAEASIEQTLRSVASQTHPDVEHIVIDGCSTDGTLGIIERHRSRLARVVSEPDQGIYDAMNKGVKLATGDIVALLNADDVYTDETVLAHIASVMENEGLDACFGDAAFFRPHDPDRCVRRYHSSRFKPERIVSGWMPAHPTLFLRRHVYEKFGYFRTDYKIAGDFEFVARIFHGDTLRYRYLPEVLVHMRTGGVSTAGWKNTIRLNREVLRACRDNGLRTHMLSILSKYPAKLLDFVFK